VLDRIAPQIQQLTKTIEETLQPVRRLRDRRDYPTGYKLNLRRLMSYHADCRGYDKLWLRKTVPARWSVIVSLLVDLSGSMQGPKAEAAVAGAVLLAETLHRLRVPFVINGFQDVLIPFCAVGEGLTMEVRHRLAEMAQEVSGNRPSGNNKPAYNDDGPCLLSAADEVLAQQYDERVLVVISDGLPEGEHSTPDDLRRGVAELSGIGAGLQLLGIGLGPGTDHVNKFYPRSVANVPVERLAAEIGGVLREALGTQRH
jgi:nitric oxide reductase activation protein